MLCTVDASIRLHLQFNRQPIYYYLFSYRGTKSFTEIFSNSKKNYGVSHFDELFYLFPLTKILFFNTYPSANDEQMAILMTYFWYNFARYG